MTDSDATNSQTINCQIYGTVVRLSGRCWSGCPVGKMINSGAITKTTSPRPLPHMQPKKKCAMWPGHAEDGSAMAASNSNSGPRALDGWAGLANWPAPFFFIFCDVRLITTSKASRAILKSALRRNCQAIVKANEASRAILNASTSRPRGTFSPTTKKISPACAEPSCAPHITDSCLCRATSRFSFFFSFIFYFLFNFFF